MIQIKSNIVTMTKEDLFELQGEAATRENNLDQIEVLVNKRLDDMVGKFNWYKSEDGKLLLEIQKIING